MTDIELVYWNPRRPRYPGPVGSRLPLRKYMNNFGDLLGPRLVSAMLAQKQLDPHSARSDTRLLTVGSIMHLAHDGDVVWGTGVNGKVDPKEHGFAMLDVRAVRGPLTRQVLVEKGIPVPEVYGDPALLLPQFLPELRQQAEQKKYALTVVPNLNDHAAHRRMPNVLNPRSPMSVCLERIARSEAVIASSLHGIIIAEALGIPARAWKSSSETPFKYQDYYAGTGRTDVEIAAGPAMARTMGGAQPLECDLRPLENAFPADLWGPQAS